MSKSLGNYLTLRDILAKGGRPEAIRYLLLSVHYRKQLNFMAENLHQAHSSIARIENFRLRLSEKVEPAEPCPSFSELVASARDKFIEAMDDDLNTSAALGVLFEFISLTFKMLDQGSLSGGDARAALALLNEIDQVFGVMGERQELLDSEISGRIEERLEARRRRDFSEADRIRDWLLSQGIQLEDTREGT